MIALVISPERDRFGKVLFPQVSVKMTLRKWPSWLTAIMLLGSLAKTFGFSWLKPVGWNRIDNWSNLN